MSYADDLRKGKVHRGNFEANREFLKLYENLWRGKKVLEIGCEAGHLTNWLREQGCEVVGVDLSKDLIAYAKKEYSTIPFRVMNAQELSFRDNSFEVVMSFDLLEHLPEPSKHLEEVKRVLKKKGVYLLQTPNKLTNVPYSVLKDRSFSKYKTYHCSLQTSKSLKQLFTKKGFSFEQTKIDVRTPFYKQKMKRTFGTIGTIAANIPLHKLPLCLQTNFYGVGYL